MVGGGRPLVKSRQIKIISSRPKYKITTTKTRKVLKRQSDTFPENEKRNKNNNSNRYGQSKHSIGK